MTAIEKQSNSSVISETYGEILPGSIQTLLSLIQPAEEDVFVDLGSGMGKVIMQVFKETPVREARGIEVIPELHERAHGLVQEMHHLQPALFRSGRKLTLILGDFLAENLEGATMVLIGSPCFGPSMLDKLAERIENTKTIHTVMSLRPLLKLHRLSLKQVFRVEGSWDSAQCYYYCLQSN